MADIVTFRDTDRECFSQLRLESGQRILISMATKPQPAVKVFQMRFGGFLPGKTVWEYDAPMAGGPLAYAQNLWAMFQEDTGNSVSPIRAMVNALVPCKSVVDVQRVLRSRQQRVLSNEVQQSAKRVATWWRGVNERLLEEAAAEHKPAIQRMVQRCDEVIAGDVFSKEELELILKMHG